jgi:hypothetical protein
MLTTQSTTFTRDVLGRYTCNTFDEAKSTDFKRFNIIIIGGGSFGAAIAEQLFQLDSPVHRRKHRILVLEGGSFLFPEHVQNLPPINAKVAGAARATTIEELRKEWKEQFGDPVPALIDRDRLEKDKGSEVWGLPWHSKVGANSQDPRDKKFSGLAYCVGGRSLFWGGWSPELIDSELADWPATIVQDLKNRYFQEAKQQLGTDTTNDFIFGDLHSALRQRLANSVNTVKNVIPTDSISTDTVPITSESDVEAPLAVQSAPLRSGFFPFNKFSAIPLLMQASRAASSESNGDDFKKRLMVVPNCHVVQLHRDQNNRISRIQTNLGDVQVNPNSIVILASGTVESTRLALLSFPNSNGWIGKNLMAHLRSNTTIRIPRASFPGLPNELQASALFVKGKRGNRHFHLQITACGLKGDISNSEQELNKKIPDIDQIEAFKKVTDNYVVLTLRGIGEMEPNKTNSPTSLVELDPEPDEHGVRRAIVTMGLSDADRLLWDSMDMAAVEVAKIFAQGSPFEYFNEDMQKWQSAPWTKRDGLGTTHHEGGTLWMGSDPMTSVTDIFGRFHEVENALAVGPAIFPTVGSPNPMLGGIALLRRTAQALIPPDKKPVVELDFTSLFDGTSTAGWQMAGTGGFILESRKDDQGDSYNVLRSEGGLGLFWYTLKKFKNFILRLDWQASQPGDNSGIFVRFPDPGNDPFVAVNQGHEIQIDDFGKAPDGQLGSLLHSTGGIYSFAAPTKVVSQLVGEWNTFEIQVTDNDYKVIFNGEVVVEKYTSSRLLEGFIGIQNHGLDSRVSFRNIRIKEL